MLYAILIIAVLVCAFGWLNRWVTTAAIILYMIGKDYELPTDAEQTACLKEVWRRVIKLDL